MELNAGPVDKKALLLTDEDATATAQARQCRRRCKQQSGSRLLVSVGIALGFMAVMFVGGWFAGRHYQHEKQDHDSKNQPQTDDNLATSTYYGLSADNSMAKVPALEGSVPITDFVQCNYASSECQSGNPMLTPKGTIQFTLYNFNGQSYVIVTSTGENYGEMPSSRKRRATNTYLNKLHFTGCEGNMMTPAKNDYKLFDNMTHFTPTNGLHIPFSYSSMSTFTHIISLLGKIPKTGCKVSFDTAPSGHGFTVRGGDDVLTSDMSKIPTTTDPLTLNNITDLIPSFEPGPVDLTQFHIPSFTPSASSGGVHMGPIAATLRKKRSIFSELEHLGGSIIQIASPITKAVESTIRIYHDQRHGGSNGSITYDVTNHTASCRSRYTMLFHNALSDGEKIVSTIHHQTHLFRYQDASGIRNLSMWQSITPAVNKVASTAYSLVGQIPSVMPCFTNEMDQMRQTVKTAWDKIKGTSLRKRRSLGWHCGLAKSLEGGWGCGDGAYKCGSDIAEGDVTFGLSLFKAGYDCFDAGDKCYNLVHNCVSW